MLQTKVQRIHRLKEVVSGVELTQEEERTLMWLAEWEDSTVDNVISIIKKVAVASECMGQITT